MFNSDPQGGSQDLLPSPVPARGEKKTGARGAEIGPLKRKDVMDTT